MTRARISHNDLLALATSDRAKLVGTRGLMVLSGLALSALGAHAQTTLPTTDVYIPSATPFTGVIGATGEFVNTMISTYGVPAILISVAVSGWMFVKHIAKSAFH